MPQPLDADTRVDELHAITRSILAKRGIPDDDRAIRAAQKERQQIWTSTRTRAIELVKKYGHPALITPREHPLIAHYSDRPVPEGSYIKLITDPIEQTIAGENIGWRLRHLERTEEFQAPSHALSASWLWTSLDVVTLDTQKVINTIFGFDRKEWVRRYRAGKIETHTQVRGFENYVASTPEVRAQAAALEAFESLLEQGSFKRDDLDLSGTNPS